MGAAVPCSVADLRSQVILGKVRVGSFCTGPRRVALAIANRRLSGWELPQDPTRDRLQTLQGATGPLSAGPGQPLRTRALFCTYLSLDARISPIREAMSVCLGFPQPPGPIPARMGPYGPPIGLRRHF